MPINSNILTGSMQSEIVIPYIVYPGNSKKTSPIIYLHGSGQRGNDLKKIQNLEISNYHKKYESACSLYLPQLSLENYSWDLNQINYFIEHIKKIEGVDKVILIGSSMGARAVWNYAFAHAKNLLGIVSLSGISVHTLVHHISYLPIWIGQGAKDTVVPICLTELTVSALKNANADKMLYSLFEDMGHCIDATFFMNPQFWTWLKNLPETIP